jgi:hypothetical protein
MALAPPVWLPKVADKIRRAFFLAQDEMELGGKCLISWHQEVFSHHRPTLIHLSLEGRD